jgi:starch phosphorylase
MALACSVRNELLKKRIHTAKTYSQKGAKVVFYLSAEFLMGRHLGNGLINLGLHEPMRHALADCGLDLDELLEREAEPGLGNGGLGRLAACFMDSLTTLNLPAVGYGIRYEFGIFTQAIRDGYQVESPDKWLSFGNPWEIARPDYRVCVKFGGHTESIKTGWRLSGALDSGPDGDGHSPRCARTWLWHRERQPILRLWKAEADEAFDLEAFNAGDYFGAVASKMISENITKVLYPNDETQQGKELRLQQQYFFVACSLQDIIRLHLRDHGTLDNLPEFAAMQMNDTHPAIAVAELMRLLIDDYHFEWDTAWEMTQRVLWLHQPHPHARGPRALVQSTCLADYCPATWS